MVFIGSEGGKGNYDTLNIITTPVSDFIGATPFDKGEFVVKEIIKSPLVKGESANGGWGMLK